MIDFKMLIALAIAFKCAAAMADDVTDRFAIRTQRKTDVVTIASDQDVATVDVTSPFGISYVTIGRKGDAWPKAMVVRLRLKGLENFKVWNGTTELEGAVAIKDGKPDVRMWRDHEEQKPLDDKNPMWVKVKIVGEEKTRAFELTLPSAIFEGNPEAISVRWIDYFR